MPITKASAPVFLPALVKDSGLLGSGAGLVSTSWWPSLSRATAERLAAALAPYAAPAPPEGTHPEDFLAAFLAERRARDVARLQDDVRRKEALLRRTS